MKQKLTLLFLFSVFLVTSCQEKGTEGNGITADPQTTPETQNLLVNLKKLTSKGIMFGHQDDLLYGHDWKYEDGRSDVKEVCGDYPAVYGWELGHIELGNEMSLDSVHFDKIRQLIKVAYRRGGVNTISWHADNPLTGGSAWDVSSNQVVKSILPGGEKHELFNTWLTRLGNFFLSLKDDDGQPIPVIFRPFHEHTGSWFWWGQKLCTTDQYVALWKYTQSFLEKMGVHNLLYAYSAGSEFSTVAQYLERYPGDDVIDVMGFDTYERNGDNGREQYMKTLSSCLNVLVKAGEAHHKLIALTETGFGGIPDSTWWTKTLWPTIEKKPISYVLVWRNAWNMKEQYFAPFEGQQSADDFAEFCRLPRTLFQQDISGVELYQKDQE
ncbi:glycoside hydrolase family 26 protein [Prolixibacter denitrificans]|uniref:Mannan endo-1,4-beta-mannosidase n=1 Tax=Prolixibacter denitrificans TaxID=1541063 RepID=A0A2P8CH49_9BACT|nr:glycosyl hydrolase [Prolixibacter denitrificans]PSK84256.1 mannan endo-1,4-beta-mannosidase [Prolixibacter denitrificans]GET20431.1 mannan endo-1,4-beta-mannosidase [Prolixibacter denitrificans]